MQPSNQEIPQDQWQSYFDQLSEAYEGWLATVEVLGSEMGDVPLAKDLPFIGLSFEREGSEAGDILIELGNDQGILETHHADHPQHVRVAQTQPGQEEDIQIECSDGTTTLVRLHPSPELPSA